MQALFRTLRCDLKREGKRKKKKGHSSLGLYQISVVVTGARLLQGHLLCTSELDQDSVPLKAAALPGLVGTQPGHVQPAETAVQPSTPPACRTRSCVTPTPPHLTRILLGLYFFLGHRPATLEERTSPTASERAHTPGEPAATGTPPRPRRGSPRPSHLTTHPGKGRRRAAGPVPPAAAAESPSGEVPAAEIPSETPGAQQREPVRGGGGGPRRRLALSSGSTELRSYLLGGAPQSAALLPSSLSADVAPAPIPLPRGEEPAAAWSHPRAGPPSTAP